MWGKQNIFFLYLLKSKTILAEIFIHTQSEAILDTRAHASHVSSLRQTLAMENVSPGGSSLTMASAMENVV